MAFILILFTAITISHAGTARLIESTIYATKQTTTPANPSSGKNKLYTKSDDKLYVLSSSGSEYALQAAGNYITAITGDITASGPGSVAATIANNAVTNAKIANSTIDLTSKVTGTLPHGNGGTDVTSPGASGNILISNGTNWTSASNPIGSLKVCAFSVDTSSDVASNVKFNCLNSTTCTDATANRASCTFATSFFSTTPICSCTEHSSNSTFCNDITVSTTTITVKGTSYLGSGADIAPDIICIGT